MFFCLIMYFVTVSTVSVYPCLSLFLGEDSYRCSQDSILLELVELDVGYVICHRCEGCKIPMFVKYGSFRVLFSQQMRSR